MNRKTLFLIISLLISASVLSACSGALPASNWSGITADQDMAYLAHGTSLFAVNLSTQQEIWRFPVKPEAGVYYYAPPVLTADDQLIAGTYGPKGYHLYSLNPANSAINWTFDQAKGDYIASPLVTENAIYAANADGNLYALDLKGKLLWTFKAGGPLWATPAVNDVCSCLFVPSMDHKLYALNADTGTIRWESGDLGGAMVSSPTFASDGTVFVGTFNSEILALDAADGSIRWRFQTDGFVWTQPDLLDGVLYFGDSKGSLYAVDTNGTQVWKINSAGPIANKPLIKNGKLFLTAGTDSVYAYTLDGVSVWQVKLDGQLQGAVVSAGDRLLVSPLSSATALFMLTEDGAQQWAFVPEK